MTEYFLEKELEKALSGVLADDEFVELEPLRKHGPVFMVAAMLKTDPESGEEKPTSGDAVVVKKITPPDKVFLEADFKVYIDLCRWKQASELQQRALLHRALMKIEVSVTEAGTSYKNRKPDIVEYHATIQRFGAWNEALLQFRENLEAAKAKAGKQKTPPSE